MRCGAQGWVTGAHGAPNMGTRHEAKAKDFMVGRGGANLKAPDRKSEFPIVSGNAPDRKWEFLDFLIVSGNSNGES